MKTNKPKIYYCFINKKYLNKIYPGWIIEQRKYTTRPFVYIKDLNIAIALPQITNHKTKTYSLNFYFNNKKYYLDVPSLIFVSEKNLYINKKWNNTIATKENLKSIENGFDILRKDILKTFKLFDRSQTFKDTHSNIAISQKIYIEEKKAEQQKSQEKEQNKQQDEQEMSM